MKTIANSIFKTFFLSLCIIANVSFSYAQTASILPPAKTQLLDNNGKPLVQGTVDYYVPGTTTRKTTWQDSGQTIPNANPVVLDSAGRALMLGNGSYRQVVKDRLNNVIWDQVTSSTGSGGGGTTATVGDGQPVGSIQAWSGFVAPASYAFSYGQEFTRAGFPELLAAITSQQNVSCTLGNPTLTGIGNTQSLPIGAKIESTCLNPGATVLSKTISTVVASANAIITTNTSARFFPYGNGDGSLTFNVPDLRGMVLAGRDNMGGVIAGRLTTVGSGVDGPSIGGAGGAQNQTIAQMYLPNNAFPLAGTPAVINSTGTASSDKLGLQVTAGTNLANGSGLYVAGNQSISVSVSANYTPAGTILLNGGTQVPLRTTQPTTMVNYVIKTLPDTNPNSYFGVASIGGMTGVLLCGTGITCAGNTITAINSTLIPPTPLILGGIFQSNAPANQFAIGVDLAGNLLYGGGSTTVNGQICTIGSSCTIVASAGTITVGTTLVSSGSANALLYNNAGTLGNITTANNSVLITNGSGVPSWATTLPTSLTIPSATHNGGVLTGTFTGTPTLSGSNFITNANIVQSAAATLKGNPTASTANASDFTIQGLTARGAPDATNDKIPLYDNAAGTIKYVTPGQIASAGASGVSSLNGQTGALSSYFPPQGRISFVTGTPVMLASQAASTNTYYTPYVGDMMPLYDGTNMIPTIFPELVQTASDTTKSPAATAANSCYNYYGWTDAGTPRATRGFAWTNITTPGANSALTRVKGILLNSVSITNGPAAQRGTFLGVICSNATSTYDFIYGASASGGIAASFGLWNAYNQFPTTTSVTDTQVSYTYTSATVRQSGGSVGNQISFIQGSTAASVPFNYSFMFRGAAIIGSFGDVGVCFDTAGAFGPLQSRSQQNSTTQIISAYNNAGMWNVGIGFHSLIACEASNGTDAWGMNSISKNTLSATIWN